MILVALGAALLGPGGLALALAGSGFALILLAKASLFRRGIWLSWGSGLMTPGSARLYRTGYVLLALGASLRVMRASVAG